jgi:hypothetical protein
MKSFILFPLVAVLLIFELHAQKAPIKFGIVDKDLLEMKYYDRDSSAPAVIVCNYGRCEVLEIGNSLRLQFTRIMRIKIFKKEGYYLADQSFRVNANVIFKGITYNLENGEIVKTKLKSESIFKERIYDGVVVARVALPNVKEGSVIDIELTSPGVPYTWEFQDRIPMMYSELVMVPSTYFYFRRNFTGYERLDESTESRWVATNVPAFKPEPYLNDASNYITKFEINLESVLLPGYFEALATSWEVIGKQLMEHYYFGIPIGSGFYLNSLADKLKASGSTGEDLVRLAVEAVKKVKWNESSNVFTSNPTLGTTFKEEIGNSADINLILLQLLNKLGFNAEPVVLSTRDNGIILPYFTNREKLNYVIAMAQVGTKTMLLDATEKYLPYYLLPLRCLNGNGIKILDDKIEWVEIKASHKDREVSYYDLKLNNDLSLEGKIINTYSDYGAFDFRKKYTGYNSQQEYIDDFQKTRPGLFIREYQLNNFDSLMLPVREEYSIAADNQLTEADDEIFLFPLLYDQMKENPFKAEERKYPVDYGMPLERSIVVKYVIPEGFSVVKIPSNQIRKTADNGANFVYSVTSMNNTVQVSYKLSITKTMFLPDEYPILRELYNLVIKAHAEPIVLKKI